MSHSVIPTLSNRAPVVLLAIPIVLLALGLLSLSVLAVLNQKYMISSRILVSLTVGRDLDGVEAFVCLVLMYSFVRFVKILLLNVCKKLVINFLLIRNLSFWMGMMLLLDYLLLIYRGRVRMNLV